MSVLNELLEYQKEDALLRKIEQEIGASEERKKYVQAKKFIESAREKLDAQEKRAIELKNLCAELSARSEEIIHALGEYSDLDEMIEGGGDVSFYKKNAQALSDKLRAIKAELNKLISDVNAITEEYKKLKEQTIVMQKQYKEYKEKYDAVKASRSEEVEEINRKLSEIGKKIPADTLERYKTKRKERIFPILVPLNGDRCVCGMDFPLAQQGRLAGGNVIECEHCRRFVYKA